MNNKKPPDKACRFLRWFLRDELAEEVQGDLEEQYRKKLATTSPFRAKLNYWYQVFNYLRPFAVRGLRSKYINSNLTTMFKHNILISFRYFKRNRTSFIINMVGLPAGMACALLIYMWVQDEILVDKFHEKSDRIYQVMENVVQDGKIITRQSTPGPMAAYLAGEMPEVEYAVTSTGSEFMSAVLSFKDTEIEAKGTYADSDFFKIFSFLLIRGNKDKALTDKKSIVISEKVSRALFGTISNTMGKIVEIQQISNAIGGVVEVQHRDDYIVTGIFRDIPDHSSLRFDFVLPFEIFRDEIRSMRSWYNTGPQTFVLLNPGTDAGLFNSKITDLVRSRTNGEADHRTPFVTLFSETYLHDHYQNGVQSGGRIEYVRLFSVIAVFILLIACINFMNLTTARASTRMKEIGIKKSIGAGRHQLILQYLGESLILSFLSLFIALLLVYLLLPQFNLITEKQLHLHPDKNLMITAFFLTTLTGLLAGSYPALYLSGFNPVRVLKGKIRSSNSELLARKGLVIFQFSISIILIVSVLVVYKQIEFIQTRNLGYDNDNILVIPRTGQLLQEEKLESFLHTVREIPGVAGASSIGHNLAGHNGGTYGVVWPGKDPADKTEFERVPVNYGMIELLGIRVIEGRTFSKEFASDSSSIIFNEAAVRFMGLRDPVGSVINLWGQNMKIIGVVSNFHFESFKQEVKPLFFYLNLYSARNIMIKIEAGTVPRTINGLQRIYRDFNPGFPMNYKFQDADYMKLYTAENRVSMLSKYFAGLAILISCLGLFGLASFTAERRMKEIGIRKIFGSGEFRIVRLLSADFTLMVLIAIAVAQPLSYLIAKNWLGGFAYHIKLSVWFFAGAGITALLIAWFTVGLQTIKAAHINPVKCLRDE